MDATKDYDLFLCGGTSPLVYPAASLPEAALSRGTMTVLINPNPTGLDGSATAVIRGAAGEVLPKLMERMR